MQLVGQGFYWTDLPVGRQLRTFGRTIAETDILNFVSVAGMLESLFVDAEYRAAHAAIPGRPAPAALVLALCEGLVLNATAQGTGLAFLGMELTVKAPVLQGDTIHVELEVIEQRAAAKLGRGLVRTRNSVVNQRGELVMVYTPLRLMAGPPAADPADRRPAQIS